VALFAGAALVGAVVVIAALAARTLAEIERRLEEERHAWS